MTSIQTARNLVLFATRDQIIEFGTSLKTPSIDWPKFAGSILNSRYTVYLSGGLALSLLALCGLRELNRLRGRHAQSEKTGYKILFSICGIFAAKAAIDLARYSWTIQKFAH